MIDIEKRAHDIAVSILPDFIKEDKILYFEKCNDGSEKINSFEITQAYCDLYEAVLKELREYGEF